METNADVDLYGYIEKEIMMVAPLSISYSIKVGDNNNNILAGKLQSKQNSKNQTIIR